MTRCLVTPLEVLRNHFGGLPSEKAITALSLDQIQELGELVSASATASVDEASDGGETYYGGGWLGSGWHTPVFKQELLHALLYYPRILVHDPLADFFSHDVRRLPEYRSYRSLDRRPMHIRPLAGDSNPVFDPAKTHREEAAGALAMIVANLSALAPLIDNGVLVLRSQWPTILQRLEPIQTSVRHNLRSKDMLAAAEMAAQDDPPSTKWDNKRGMAVIPSSGIHPSDRHLIYQEDFFYLSKTLAIAEQSAARYMPQTDADFRLLAAYAEELPAKVEGLERPPGRVVEEVVRLVAPHMSLDPKVTVSLRRDEESFEDWRLSLRRLAREGSSDDDNVFAQRVEEELKPRIHIIKRNLNRKKSVADLTPDGLEVAISSGIGATAGGAAALSVLPGALKWLYSVIKKPAPGNDTVLARLIQK